MDDGLRLSEAEIQKIFSLLSSSTTFQGFTKGVLTEFIKNCDVNDLGPHDLIWDEQNGNDLDFMVVVAGCVAVWGKNYDEETVDAFLGPGKIIGASEYFRLDSTASQFKTLTDCRLLVASQIAIDVLKENATSELTESERCQLFYRNICRSLLERLRSQISVLKVRTGQNDKRLAKLFENFQQALRYE